MLYLACIFPFYIKKITLNINDHSISDFKITTSRWKEWARYEKKEKENEKIAIMIACSC